MWLNVLLSLIFTLLLFQGCAPTFIPNAFDKPSYQAEDETEIEFINGNGGFELKGARALDDKSGISTALVYRYDERSKVNHSTQLYFSAAWHRFMIQDNVRVDMLAGLGVGRFYTINTNLILPLKEKASYMKPWLQFSYSFWHLYYETGAIVRTGYLSLLNFESNANSENTGAFTFEPGLFARFGEENFKISSQIGWVLTPGKYDGIDINHGSLIFNIGIYYQFDWQNFLGN